jgi:hypothetical protein
MSATVEQVLVEALSLPTRSRAELAHKLLSSLGPDVNSPEIEAAWKAEALDRCKAFDEGKMTEKDSADVLREAYKKVK